MLNELRIENYRIFKTLTVTGLKRVNLIAGKNNVGKTAFLEALRLLASEIDNTVVNHILKQRGQFTPSWDSSYDALFNWETIDDSYAMIHINSLDISKNKNGDYSSMTVDADLKLGHRVLSSSISADYPKDSVIYIPFSSFEVPLQALWDKIALTDQEDDVMHIIRETVEPSLVRLDISGGQARVRLKNKNTPIPIQSLGDGVQRMLLLALALVNAKGKMLLIDEFEAGLHHSVQEKLWNLTFHYAKLWDIQVFATTHSEDTLRSFYYVASKPEYKNEAFFMRLQFDRNGKLEAVPYDIERLESALELNMEIR